MAGSLEGQTCVCIGGASGMGRGVAEAALALGGKVIVTSRTSERAEAAAHELGCEGKEMDLTDRENVRAFFAEFATIDHLVITAGATGRTAFDETAPDEAAAFMDAKLWATHRCLWEARPTLAAHASISLITGGYSLAATNAAGHVHIAFQAVEALARVVAVSFAPVRCNVFRPGFIDSALWDFMSESERADLREAERAKLPSGHIVSQREFGDAAVAIMQSRAITGAVIPVDGGRHLHTCD